MATAVVDDEHLFEVTALLLPWVRIEGIIEVFVLSKHSIWFMILRRSAWSEAIGLNHPKVGTA